MNTYYCSIVTSDELKALLDSDESETKERALTHIEALSTRDAEMWAHGYAFLEEGITTRRSARVSTTDR